VGFVYIEKFFMYAFSNVSFSEDVTKLPTS